MNFEERLLELLELEKTLESQLERIYETRKDLTTKETIFRQQLDFTRGQIRLLQELESKEEKKSKSIIYKDLNLESSQKIEKLEELKKPKEEKKKLDPFPQPGKKAAQITGMRFLK